MELRIGAEEEDKMKITSLISIILSFFTLCGCSTSEMAHSIEPSKTPALVGNGTPVNVAVILPKPNVNANSQTLVVERNKKPTFTKSSDGLCENYLLKKINEEKANGSRILRLKTFNPDDETLSPELKEWLQTKIHLEMLVAFELQSKEKKLLLLRANVAGATGIAASFENWFIQFDSYSINFQSLSDNPKLIFFDKEGLVNYYSIDFNYTSKENKNWDDVPLNLLQYKITSNGESQLVGEEPNVKCK